MRESTGSGETVRRGGSGRTLTIVGFVLAAIGILVVPIVLGPLGAVLGYLGLRKGDALGKWAIAAGIAATVIGLALSAALMTAITGG